MFKMYSTNPYELDWGNVTPDGYQIETREVLYVFNFDISSTAKIERCILFTIGKIIWTDKHIPENTNQKVIFDLRGQPLMFLERARKMKEAVIGGIKKNSPSLNIIIEILI